MSLTSERVASRRSTEPWALHVGEVPGPAPTPDRASLEVNPGLRVSSEPVPGLWEGTWAFVEAPVGSDCWLPYRLRQRWLEPVTGLLERGTAALADLSDEQVAALVQAQVLVSAPAPTWEAEAATLKDRGAVLIPGFWSRSFAQALADHFRRIVNTGQVGRPWDGQFDRYAEHNNTLSRYLQRQLVPFLTRLVGAALQPSYTFWCGYVPGLSTLPKHRDRPQCRWNLDLLCEQTPAGRSDFPWPLMVLDRHGEERPYRMEAGDLLVYHGAELWHQRPGVLPEGCNSINLLLHYVPADFVGELD